MSDVSGEHYPISADQMDIDYWKMKFAVLKLGAAMDSRQPHAPSVQLANEIVSACATLLERYPRHASIMQWQRQAAAVASRGGTIPRGGAYRRNFCWNDPGFESSWIHYHMAIRALYQDELECAALHAGQAWRDLSTVQLYMSQWPGELRQWVRSALAYMPSIMVERGG